MAKGFVTFQMKLRGEEPPVPLKPLSSFPSERYGTHWDQLMETPVESVTYGLINRSFLWDFSPQGNTFWRKFYYELQNRSAGREPQDDPDFQKALDYIEDWQRQWRER